MYAWQILAGNLLQVYLFNEMDRWTQGEGGLP